MKIKKFRSIFKDFVCPAINKDVNLEIIYTGTNEHHLGKFQKICSGGLECPIYKNCPEFEKADVHLDT